MLIRLLHFEYLSFDEKTSEVFIPNREIAREFYEVSKSGSWDEPIQALECSDSIARLWRTWHPDDYFWIHCILSESCLHYLGE